MLEFFIELLYTIDKKEKKKDKSFVTCSDK